MFFPQVFNLSWIKEYVHLDFSAYFSSEQYELINHILVHDKEAIAGLHEVWRNEKSHHADAYLLCAVRFIRSIL